MGGGGGGGGAKLARQACLKAAGMCTRCRQAGGLASKQSWLGRAFSPILLSPSLADAAQPANPVCLFLCAGEQGAAPQGGGAVQAHQLPTLGGRHGRRAHAGASLFALGGAQVFQVCSHWEGRKFALRQAQRGEGLLGGALWCRRQPWVKGPRKRAVGCHGRAVSASMLHSQAMLHGAVPASATAEERIHLESARSPTCCTCCCTLPSMDWRAASCVLRRLAGPSPAPTSCLPACLSACCVALHCRASPSPAWTGALPAMLPAGPQPWSRAPSALRCAELDAFQHGLEPGARQPRGARRRQPRPAAPQRCWTSLGP